LSALLGTRNQEIVTYSYFKHSMPERPRQWEGLDKRVHARTGACVGQSVRDVPQGACMCNIYDLLRTYRMLHHSQHRLMRYKGFGVRRIFRVHCRYSSTDKCHNPRSVLLRVLMTSPNHVCCRYSFLIPLSSKPSVMEVSLNTSWLWVKRPIIHTFF
jgi:hypothetical protein